MTIKKHLMDHQPLLIPLSPDHKLKGVELTEDGKAINIVIEHPEEEPEITANASFFTTRNKKTGNNAGFLGSVKFEDADHETFVFYRT